MIHDLLLNIIIIIKLLDSKLFLCQQKLQDLQSHIQTTRERTKKLLEEKDNEILVLRGELQAVRERSSVASSPENNTLSTGAGLV